MQRVWRSKPSPELIRLMEESVDIRLYLVAEKGPLSFTFQDDKGKKVMISIGDRINCNCTGNKKEQKEHCVHTLYVLNRLFKISFSDQLILQLQYSDSELNKMIETRRRTKNKIDLPNEDSESEDEVSNKKKKKKRGNNIAEENRMNLLDDITCSICQEDMYFAEGLFYCEDSCGHNFHLDCLKIWTTHKKANEESLISCPMCRQRWDDDKLKKQIVKNMAFKKNIKAHKEISCKNCERKNIKGERFHCLICEDYNLCIECFNLGKHKYFHLKKENKASEENSNDNFSSVIFENPLIIKKTPEDSWHGFEILLENDEDQCKYTMKQIKFSQYLISLLKDFDGKSIQKTKNNTQIENINQIVEENDLENETDDQNHEENKEENEGNTNIFDNQNTNTIKNEIEKANLNLQDLNCIGCNKAYRSSTIHLLKYKQTPICEHIIHVKCVELLFKISIDKSSNFRVEEGFNICKLDKSHIFPGLKSLKFKIYKQSDEAPNSNNNNNQLNSNNKMNHNDFYVGNSNNLQIQNLVNNNFPSSSQKNKIFTGRVLSNKNKFSNKMNKDDDFFDNALQINNFGLKVAPLTTGGKSMSGRLAPINHIHQNINVNDFYTNNQINKKKIESNKKTKLNNNSSNNVINLAINIQKVNFDEENKIQNFEKTAKEKMLENKTKRLSAGKYQNSRRIIYSINKKSEKSSGKLMNSKPNRDITLPDLRVFINKYDNNDLPEVNPEFLGNEVQLNEDIMNTRIINKPLVRGYGIRTINHNNIGFKVIMIIKFL